MPTRTPKKTTPETEKGVGVILVAFSTVLVILAADGLRDLNRGAIGVEMIAVGIALNGFVRVRYGSADNSWVAKGGLILIGAGLGLIGMKQPAVPD